MEVTMQDFLVKAKAKIDLLATAVDSASVGLNCESHPRAQASVAIADTKLKKLCYWYGSLESSSQKTLPAEDAAVLNEFLDREIAGAQSYLAGSSDKISGDYWWTVGLLAFFAALALAFLLT